MGGTFSVSKPLLSAIGIFSYTYTLYFNILNSTAYQMNLRKL